MRSVLICVVPFVVLLCFACADKRESLVREHMQREIAERAAGVLSLSSLRKTDGYEQDVGGAQLYTLEWEAHLTVHADAWKLGWNDFRLLAARPNALESAVFGTTPRRLTKGSTVTLLGESQLRKTEQGWRVLSLSVKASKVEPSSQPASPVAAASSSGDGRSEVTFQEGPEGELPTTGGDQTVSDRLIVAPATPAAPTNGAKIEARRYTGTECDLCGAYLEVSRHKECIEIAPEIAFHFWREGEGPANYGLWGVSGGVLRWYLIPDDAFGGVQAEYEQARHNTNAFRELLKRIAASHPEWPSASSMKYEDLPHDSAANTLTFGNRMFAKTNALTCYAEAR